MKRWQKLSFVRCCFFGRVVIGNVRTCLRRDSCIVHPCHCVLHLAVLPWKLPNLKEVSHKMLAWRLIASKLLGIWRKTLVLEARGNVCFGSNVLQVGSRSRTSCPFLQCCVHKCCLLSVGDEHRRQVLRKSVGKLM